MQYTNKTTQERDTIAADITVRGGFGPFGGTCKFEAGKTWFETTRPSR